MGSLTLTLTLKLCLAVSLVASLYAGEPPSFVRTPQPTSVPHGHTVTLSAETTFEPTLRWQWRKNGLLLTTEGSDTNQLPIYHATAKDTGSYQAVAINIHGERWSPAAEIVVLPPTSHAGRVDDSFTDPGFDGGVTNLVPLSDGNLLAAGTFFRARGMTLAANLCRLLPSGEPDPSYRGNQSGPNASIFALAAGANGTAWIAGNFTAFDDAPSPALVKLNAQGEREASFLPNLPANVEDIRILVPQPNGSLYVGGRSRAGTTVTDWLVRLLPNGIRDIAFTSPVFLNGRLRALALRPDGKLWLAGNFFRSSGNAAQYNRVALVGPAGGIADPGFIPPAGSNSGANLEIRTLHLLPDGSAVVGGFFNRFNGTQRQGLAKVLANGGLDVNFDPPANDASVQALSSDSQGQIYAGGDISLVGTTPIRSIFRLHGTTGQLDATWQPPMSNGPVLGMMMTNTGLLTIGNFDLPQHGVVKLATTATMPPPNTVSLGMPIMQANRPFQSHQHVGSWIGPQSVPDAGTLEFPTSMQGAGVIGEIRVWLDLRHDDVQTLDVTLEAPPSLGLPPMMLIQGSTLRHGSHFLRTLLTPRSVRPLSQAGPPYTDALKPAAELHPLFGMAFTGNWTLRVTDARLDGRTAQLLSWTLEIITPAEIPTVDKWLATFPKLRGASFAYAGEPSTTLAASPWTMTHHCWPTSPTTAYRYWETLDLVTWHQVMPIAVQKRITPATSTLHLVLPPPTSKKCWWRVSSP